MCISSDDLIRSFQCHQDRSPSEGAAHPSVFLVSGSSACPAQDHRGALRCPGSVRAQELPLSRTLSEAHSSWCPSPAPYPGPGGLHAHPSSCLASQTGLFEDGWGCQVITCHFPCFLRPLLEGSRERNATTWTAQGFRGQHMRLCLNYLGEREPGFVSVDSDLGPTQAAAIRPR